MKTAALSLLFAFVFIFSGCITPPSREAAANADYGPLPDNYKEVVNHWISDSFFDPYSIRDLEITEPVHGAMQRGLIQGGGYIYCWRVFVSVNGKNRYGAYVGKTQYVVLIRDGQMIYHEQAPGRTLPAMIY